MDGLLNLFCSASFENPPEKVAPEKEDLLIANTFAASSTLFSQLTPSSSLNFKNSSLLKVAFTFSISFASAFGFLMICSQKKQLAQTNHIHKLVYFCFAGHKQSQLSLRQKKANTIVLYFVVSKVKSFLPLLFSRLGI